MREFFSQLTDEDNVTNGTRVLSIVYGEHTEYDPTDYSQLPLMKNIEWSDGLINEFNSTVHLDPCTWPVVDLFGTLDLSETNTYSINISSPVHISALYANNCTNLYRLAYISQNDISVIINFFIKFLCCFQGHPDVTFGPVRQPVKPVI